VDFFEWIKYYLPAKKAEEFIDFKKKPVFAAFDFDHARHVMSKAADELNEYTGMNFLGLCQD
jgi:hypothetical protein